MERDKCGRETLEQADAMLPHLSHSSNNNAIMSPLGINQLLIAELFHQLCSANQFKSQLLMQTSFVGIILF